eukprot:m51a1_g9134 hypothetical protein (768) ;mRNA; r:50910-54428
MTRDSEVATQRSRNMGPDSIATGLCDPGAPISLAASLALAAVVISPIATMSTEFSLSQIEKIINMQLDLHVATVRDTVETQLTRISGHYATLVHASALPAATDVQTMTMLYWGYKDLQKYLTWACFLFPDDLGHYVGILNSASAGLVISRGAGIIDKSTSLALVEHYRATETDGGTKVVFKWFRNITLSINSLLAGQLTNPMTRKIQPSASTGQLGIVYTVRLCKDGTTCAPEASGQAGILQLVASSSDLSDNLLDSLSDSADPKARAFVTDDKGKLVATSHGVPSVLVGTRLQYLLCNNNSVGDSTLVTIGRDLLRAGKQGKELNMYRTSSHIVSSQNFAVGNAGDVWTIYYAVPTQTVYGDLYKTVGVCVGIAAALALTAAVVSWVALHLFLAKPLDKAVKTINTLARMNMNGIAEASSSLRPHHAVQGLPKRADNAPQMLTTATFLDEVSGVLVAADKLVHSLYCVGRYVSMDLATWVIGKGIASSPLEPRDVSVLFCDIEGSTTMIDRCRAEGTMGEFAEMLNEILTKLANTAKDYGGYIDKFIGDEVMVVFNAPCECPQHESRACEAAVAMQRCIKTLRQRWEGSGTYKSFTCPRVRVSVASGTVLVGDIGAFGTLVNYTAIGEVVCIAARLQEVAKHVRPPTGILVTGETWNAAVASGSVSLVTDDSHTACVGHSCGVTTVRGCSLPLALYTVLGSREDLGFEALSNATHFQRAMEAQARGDRDDCAQELAKVDADYIPSVRAAVMESHNSGVDVLDLATK